jgi:SAUR family protein
LWKKAEEKYEFKQKGLITIPCKIEDFRKVQQSIDMEKSHHHHHAWCFKV